MQYSDVMIYIHNPLDALARSGIEGRLRGMAGVAGVQFDPTRQRMLMLAFDPSRTSPALLLQAVSSAGYTAGLIGL